VSSTPGGEPLLGEIVQARRILRPPPAAAQLRADARVGEPRRAPLLRCHRRLWEWDHRAGRIGGCPNALAHPLDQLVRHGVLEPLRFGVHTAPVVTQVLREVELEDGCCPRSCTVVDSMFSIVFFRRCDFQVGDQAVTVAIVGDLELLAAAARASLSVWYWLARRVCAARLSSTSANAVRTVCR